MPFILKQRRKYLLDRAEFNESEKIFKVRSSSDPNNTEVLFSYILPPVRENISLRDYTLFLLYKLDFSENDIFQVYDRESDRRIGWIFPLQSLLSTDHDYAENRHFLKYAYAAYQKLLIKVENQKELPISERQKYDLIKDEIYDENSIICLLSNETLDSDFDFSLYHPNLFKYGYYIKNIRISNSKPLPYSSEKRFTLRKTVSHLKDEVYIKELFGEMIYEQHPLVKFHLLYQVIELLLEKILHNELELLTDRLKKKKIYTRDFEDKLKSFMTEEKRINKLFNEYERGLSVEDLQDQCGLLLRTFGKEEQADEDFPKPLYALRNFIVHDYRNIPRSEIADINEMNAQFEILVADILTNFIIPA